MVSDGGGGVSYVCVDFSFKFSRIKFNKREKFRDPLRKSLKFISK